MENQQGAATASCRSPVTCTNPHGGKELTCVSVKVSCVRANDIEVAECHMQKLLDLVHKSNAGVDVYDIIDRFQLDLVSQVFLGESTNSLSATQQPFRKAMETLLTYNTNRLLFGYVPLMPLPDQNLDASEPPF